MLRACASGLMRVESVKAPCGGIRSRGASDKGPWGDAGALALPNGPRVL